MLILKNIFSILDIYPIYNKPHLDANLDFLFVKSIVFCGKSYDGHNNNSIMPIKDCFSIELSEYQELMASILKPACFTMSITCCSVAPSEVTVNTLSLLPVSTSH